LKRTRLLLYFFLPFFGVVLVFMVLSSLDRRYNRARIEELVSEQLRATARILSINISHLLSENVSAEDIFALYAGEENIYYTALLDENKEILAWISQFEGYLPLSLESDIERQAWILDSPAGEIYNVFTSFRDAEDRKYFLYLGYSLKNLEDVVRHSRNSFWVILGLILITGLFVFGGFYQLQKRSLDKEKEAEEQKKQKERFREISAFTSGVAHEIKNPLNSLSLLFELLRKQAPEELTEDIVLGKKEVQKIAGIIDQFSDSLKPINLQRERFQLGEAAEEAWESLLKNRRDKSVSLKMDIREAFELFADRRLMVQVFSNLLRNALEATGEGEILMTADIKKGVAFIEVRDYGSGISDQDAPRVFDPFFSAKKQGMGIGLYLTKKIIEAHAGEISFSSRPGRGTCFRITIPGE